MGKYIVLAASFALLFWLVRAALRRAAGRRGDSRPNVTEDMVRCAQCGIHLPRGESLMTRGEVFCCTEHQRQYSDRSKGR